MNSTIETSQAISIDPALARRIVEMSEDSAPEEFPVMSLSEPLEMTMRRQAEERFQRALAHRTWWRLNGNERALIGEVVMAKEPWLRRRSDNACLESSGCNEILRVLKQGRHR